MDQRLKTALEYADYVTTFKNQKRVLQETYNKDCTVYYCGGQFTATREFITSVLAVKCDVFVDNNQTPIEVLDKEDFYNVLARTFTDATEKYHSEYQKIVKSQRTVQGIIDV